MPSKRQMFRSSMVVGFFSLLGGLTGILVETSIAAKLGLSRSSDAFYVAFTVPYIITNLLSATGQFSLVPFFATVDTRPSSDELWRRFSYVVNILFLGLGGITIVGAATAPWLIRGIAPGFSAEQVELASHLSRWLFLILVPAGIAETFRSFLLSQRHYALPSAAGLFRNVTVIASILLTYQRYGAYSIALGYLAGYSLQLAILGGQVLISFPVRYAWVLSGSGEAFRKLRGAGTAQVGSAAAWQGVVIAERIIASFLPAGTLTALNYGFKIMSTLAELLGGSVGTVALPALSRAVARQAHDEVRKTFRDALEISLAVVVPTMVFCLMLPTPITRLVFERGNFTPAATVLMAIVFTYYSLSLVPFSLLRLFSFHLFARHEPGTFLRLSALQYGLIVGFNLFYVGVLRLGAKAIPIGVLTGLVLASALAIHRNLGDLQRVLDRTLAFFALKTVVGALAAALALGGLRLLTSPPLTGFRSFVYLCGLCGAGSVVYLLTLAALRAFAIRQLAALWPGASES